MLPGSKHYPSGAVCVAHSTADPDCLIPLSWTQPWQSRAVPWEAAAVSLQCCISYGETGQSCWILPRAKALGLSVAVALIRAVFCHYY